MKGVKALSLLRAFTAETAANLTGVSEDQLRRWDTDGFFVPTFADENRRRPYSRIFSYADLVALRTIAHLKELGVSQHALKKSRRVFPYPHERRLDESQILCGRPPVVLRL